MDLIKIDVRTGPANLLRDKFELIALGVTAETKKPAGLLAQIDKALGGQIAKLLALGDFKAKANSTAMLYANGSMPSERILLVGLGDEEKIDMETLRKAAAVCSKESVGVAAQKIAIDLTWSLDSKFDAHLLGQTLTEGLHFGAYKWDQYFSKPAEDSKESKKLAALLIEPAKDAKQFAAGSKIGSVIGAAQNWGRTLANQPGNVVNPPVLAGIAKKMAAENKIKCTILDEKTLAKKGFGGICAVGSGSASKPRLIILEYKGGPKNAKTVALVGKAITFDSGGISIKPSQGMEDMKLDKSGGVAVMATLRAIAQLDLPINVIGLIPSAENLPSATSFRPGDIVKTYNGKTVEIQNTDAEGRMVLCDAIALAAEKKVDAIVDIATLTGACMVALGKYKAGLMSNNDEVIEQLQGAAKVSGEAVWHLPSSDEYLDEMKSKIADLKNIGSRWGGASNAAAFLGQFAGEIPWAHIDMAGVDLFESPKSFSAIGSSGYGVRLLTAYVRSLCKK